MCEPGTMDVPLKAPKGKFRVITTDVTVGRHWLQGDYNEEKEACDVADKHNNQRTDPMNLVFSVYDDTGKFLRGVQHATNGVGQV